MLRFIDGFDHYTSADIAMKWTSKYEATAGNVAIQSAFARRGGQALKASCGISAGNGYVAKTLDAQATWVVGFAFYMETLPTTNPLTLLGFYDGSTLHVKFRVLSDGTIQAYRNTTLLGTSTAAVVAGVWQFLEFKVTISDTVGVIGVKSNGNSVLSLTSQDTRNAGNASATSIRVGSLESADYTNTGYFEDLYILDATGTVNNDYLGDVRVDYYSPNGNGNYSQFVGSDGNSTDNYLLVDDTIPDGDTTYVQSSTVDNIDSYTLTDMVHTPSNIYGVQFNTVSKKDDAGTRAVADLVRISATDYAGSGQNLSTSYQSVMAIRETDPSTTSAWTKSGFNAAEFGIKVTA